MQNKEYFTPTIEDFYFGYEFEYQAPDKKWHKVTYYTNDTEKLNFIYIGPKRLQELIDKEQVRVLYLTKEQIEAEGWVFLKQQDYFNQVYNKTIKDFNYILYCYENYTSKKQEITIEFNFKATNNSDKLISGALCRDINTFRKIQKILKLK